MNRIKLQFLIFSIATVLLHLSASGQHFETQDLEGMKWYKGSLHTHAREDETDSSVKEVVKWYMDKSYDFMVITDHSVITLPPEDSNQQDTSFLVITGEEVIGYGNGDRFEISALDIHKAILPIQDSSMQDALQKCIDAVWEEQGVAVINHPNFNWALGKEMLLESRNCNLFELYNGYPGVNNDGDDNHPGMEKVWDFLLTSKRRMYGVAVDDGHIYKRFSQELSNPGRGWVVVRAKSLDVKEIIQNLNSGLFYSSTGVEIDDIRIEPKRLEIVIKKIKDTEYNTEFIGSDGKLLLSTKSNPAVYELATDSNYVRAKITGKEGSFAWVQPLFIIK